MQQAQCSDSYSSICTKKQPLLHPTDTREAAHYPFFLTAPPALLNLVPVMQQGRKASIFRQRKDEHT